MPPERRRGAQHPRSGRSRPVASRASYPVAVSAVLRALRPGAPAPGPLRPVAPVPACLLLRVLGVELAAGILAGLHRDLALLPGPEVLLALPLAAAGVLEQRDAREVDGALAAGVVPPVLHVEDDAPALDIDRVPLVRSVDLAVPRHHGLDPGSHRLASLHRAVIVLEVGAVLGEQIGPRVPVLT